MDIVGDDTRTIDINEIFDGHKLTCRYCNKAHLYGYMEKKAYCEDDTGIIILDLDKKCEVHKRESKKKIDI